MRVNLVIPRHKYRSLDGIRPESLSLSLKGKQALDRLATCSRSAAADLAIQMVSAVVFDKPSIESIGLKLIQALDNDSLAWVSKGLEDLAEVLDENLKIPTT